MRDSSVLSEGDERMKGKGEAAARAGEAEEEHEQQITLNMDNRHRGALILPRWNFPTDAI